MRKTTKKLLSSALAGLFVLSSLPLMGAAEAEGNTALAYTPTLDGVKDEAYEASYSRKIETSFGSVDFSFLYDDDYIYVYADSVGSSGWDCFTLGMMLTDSPKENWGAVEQAVVLASNPHLDGNDLRHWISVMNTGHKNLGWNLGWQSGTKPEDETMELVDTTPASEYALVRGEEKGAVLEFRIAYKGITKGDSVSVSMVENTEAWSGLWGGTDYETFVLGDEYTVAPAGDEAIKYTPVLDGVKDAAYDKSYNFHMDATYGGVDGSFLYDADYIYMYLDVTSAEKSLWDIFGISMIASATPNNDMTAACKAAVHLVSNPFYEGNEIRNWQQVMTGYQNLGFNLGWQESVPEDDTLELVKTTPATEFAANATETGTGLEIRIAYKNLAKGDAISFATDAGTESWGKVWGSDNYETFILGDDFGHTHVFDEEYTVDVAPTCVSKGSESRHCKDFAECGGKTDVREIAMIDHNVVDGTCTMCGRQNVKKATPTLDGVLDDAYLSSGVYKTVDNATAGKAEFGWSNPGTSKRMALIRAGIMDTEGKLLPGGDFSASAFAKAETYFLWDDDAIYVFSKVYDDAIFPTVEDDVNAWIDAGQKDVPWINDLVQHSISFLGDSANNITVMANAGGNAVFARNANGVTTLEQYLTYDNNANVAGTVGEGYYTVEVRLPVNNDLKEYFLIEGVDFDYGYGIFDVSAEKSEDGGNGMNHGEWVWIKNQDNAAGSFILVADDTPVDPGDDTTAPDVSDTAEPPTESETEVPVDPDPSSNIIKKGTPELDGVLDGKYLDSAVYRTIDGAKTGKAEFGWQNPSTAKRMALIRAGVMNADGELLPDGDFSVSAFAKSETYFLWDDDALYIFSTVYDSDPLAIVGEDAAYRNDWAYNDIPWLSDNIVHNIYTAAGNLAIEANAGGELVYDRLLNATPLIDPVVSSIVGRCTWENSDNVRGVVESDRYTIEVRIPILDSVKSDVLKDGAEFDYGYWLFDGDGHPTDAKWTWIKNTDTELTTFTLSADEAVDKTEDTTDPTPTDTIAPPEDTETDPTPTDTPDPDGSDTNEPPTDTADPDVSDTNEPPTDTADPDVSDTDEPTPDNLGDVNGDGVVNSKDLVRLMRHVAGDTTVEIVGSADINNDGKVNSKDLVALMKIIAATEA